MSIIELRKHIHSLHLCAVMPNGDVYQIPVLVIAEHRAAYMALTEPEFVGDQQRALDEDTIPLFIEEPQAIIRWASDEMTWDDISKHAELVKKHQELPHLAWTECKKSIYEEEELVLQPLIIPVPDDEEGKVLFDLDKIDII
jgi:hypothetical protein